MGGDKECTQNFGDEKYLGRRLAGRPRTKLILHLSIIA
jgi:hypothetical protein